MTIEKAIRDLLDRDHKISSGVENKNLLVTHFQMKDYVTYYSLPEAAEIRLHELLAQAYDFGVTTYIHEYFSPNFALMFDIDSPPSSKELKDILAPIYAAIRNIFVINDPDLLNCIVFSACSEVKMSYHIHFPDIIVNKQVLKMLYDFIFKKDNSMREYIDEQIISSTKLRMAFSDKWNKNEKQPEGRRLMYHGAYNCRGVAGQRYFPHWESESLDLIKKGCVRRIRAELTQTSNLVGTLDGVTTVSHLDMGVIDFSPHDEDDFSNMTPEYYCLTHMQLVVEFIKQRYETKDNKLMMTKLVRYMNNFVWLISDHPGKTIFIIRKYITGRKKQQWSYIQKQQRDFLQVFQHVKIPVHIPISGEGEGYKRRICSIGDIWMTHPERRCFSSIIFDPRPGISLKTTDFNTYQGMLLGVQDCVDYVVTTGLNYKKLIEPILKHIREIWCADHPGVYTYVIKWLAHAVRKPYIKLGVALVLIGSEGCGKSMLIDAIGYIFGNHYLHIMDMEDLVGKFTSILQDKLFLFADEAFWGGNKSLSGKLKGMITEKQIRIEHKGFDTYYVDNFTNYVIASNHHHAVPAGENARRWCCLGCSNKYNGNATYFQELHSSIYDNDFRGLKCLITYFEKDIDIENFVAQKFPITPLLRAQKENSYDSVESWWDQVLHRGYIINWEDYKYTDPEFENEELIRKKWNGGKYGHQIMPMQKIYQTYKEESTGTYGKTSSYQRFFRYMKDRNMFIITKCPEHAEKRRETWILINFSEFRNSWRNHHCDPDMVFETERI